MSHRNHVAPAPKDDIEKVKQFEDFYKNLGSQVIPEDKRIDYVLVYPVLEEKDVEDPDDREEFERQHEIRERFELAIKEEGLLKQKIRIEDQIYTKIHCPFKRLCVEAEKVTLEMPLLGCESENKDEPSRFTDWINKKFKTDNEVDMVSAPFKMERMHLYENFNDPTNFFRPSVRSLLVEHILINIDLRVTGMSNQFKHATANGKPGKMHDRIPLDIYGILLYIYKSGISLTCHSKQIFMIKDGDQIDLNIHQNTPLCGNGLSKLTPYQRQTFRETCKKCRLISESSYLEPSDLKKGVGNCWGCLKDDDGLTDMQKVGLDYMILEGVYTGKFILHEESKYDPDTPKKNKELPKDPASLKDDPRFDLQLTWTKFFKFQPLWKIRNYFGEKIAFYFAWSGTLISTLWLPMLFGFAIFIYGLVKSIQSASDDNSTSTSNSTIGDLFKNVKESFDNDVTPYFALFLCVWGTVFLEFWKRNQSDLAYKWDVEQFEENEPDRPEFYGTKHRKDPVTFEDDWYYPFARRAWKIFLSSLSLLFMVLLVCVSVMGVIVYRVIVSVDYCPGKSTADCLVVSTIISSVLNAISILILGLIYNMLAKKLTEWENHRTQTKYNDALIIKLFGFQFVNNYASCFYIAFFRGRFGNDGVLGKGSDYADYCDGTCMSQLSFQILVLMVTKPIPKLFKDNILPIIMKQLRKRCTCLTALPIVGKMFKQNKKPKSEMSLLEIELEKPALGNFTLLEYTEKVILYGLMMLFAASFPLAPLLALLLLLIDIRLDANRMLWTFRRPMAVIAEDIGTWYVILEFLNFAGVVSNAFLIAFTASWGAKYNTTEKLWIVIGFEHICFTLKFLLAYLIPDIPSGTALAMRKKRYVLNKKVNEDMKGTTGGGGVVKKAPSSRKKLGPLRLPNIREATNYANYAKEDETDIRRLKKKNKQEDSRARDSSPPDEPRRTKMRNGYQDDDSDLSMQHYPYDNYRR